MKYLSVKRMDGGYRMKYLSHIEICKTASYRQTYWKALSLFLKKMYNIWKKFALLIYNIKCLVQIKSLKILQVSQNVELLFLVRTSFKIINQSSDDMELLDLRRHSRML